MTEQHTTPAQPSDELLDEFVQGFDFALDDYQIEACRAIESGSGVLVAAPTGAGKTVPGEFAVHCALASGRKCFYTTPIKALSNQKYHDLVERYGADRIGLLTGDTSINSEAQVVVMTTEVLRNMIYASSTTLNNLGYVVMDEVHYLADRFRGAVWEEVILLLARSVQLIGLSATVSNAEEFGEWLDEVRGDAKVVVSERRPVPLFQQVMAGRRLYDLFEDEAPTARELPGTHPAEVNPELLSLAKSETRRMRDDSRRPRGRSGKGKRAAGYGSGRYGGATARTHSDRGPRLTPSRSGMVDVLERQNLLPAIVFVFSRQGCDTAVHQLLSAGTRLTTNKEAQQLEEIAHRHLSAMSRPDLIALDFPNFLEALTRGIAAHHAGMLPAFKAVVEEAFEAGLLKIVFATETLALGINMPARTVVLEKLVKYNGQTHADITPGEYTQLTGRAGRRGIDVEGHAVVLWQPGVDPRALAGLASRRTYPLRSSFSPTYNMAVNMVARVGRSKARSLLELSFAQFQADRSVVQVVRRIEQAERTVADYLAAAHCDLGDFAEYARIREEISQLEAEAARSRKSDRRAESSAALERLNAGDLIWVPAGKHRGWAVVIDPNNHGADPRPLVMTAGREIVRLSLADFPQPTTVVGRIRVPKKFDPRESSARKSLANALRDKLRELDPVEPDRYRAERDEQVAEQIGELRTRMREHPCHACPDRESHARFAERAMAAERDVRRDREKIEKRTGSIAARFDRICGVLDSLGYLDPDEPDLVPEPGRQLARIYSSLDLVTAEAIRSGVFDDLDVPQLAAVLSCLVYESRARDRGTPARMPDGPSEKAAHRLRELWREIGRVERDFKLERAPDPDIGFAEAAYAWADQRSLPEVLEQAGLPAGDFVRWVRQVIDMAGQVADASGGGDLRRRCRQVVDAMRRSVVTFDPDED